MRKLCCRAAICVLIVFFAYFGTLLCDRERLGEELIRIHVVANSDSPEDQSLKLQVKDAVLKSIRADLGNISDIGEAKSYLRKNLPKIKKIAGNALEAVGCDDAVDVKLHRESFERKTNGIISLPAGVYESLRITIGSGEGKNWWSVVFPEICGVVSEQEEPAKMVSGFDDAQEHLRNDGYAIRFYILDMMGRLENIFFEG